MNAPSYPAGTRFVSAVDADELAKNAIDRGVDLVLGWHDGPATQAAKAYAAIETVCAARAGELIAEHGLDELVNKKHEGGGVIYGLRVVKLIEYTREERKAILYLTNKIDDDTLIIDRRLDELESLEKTGRMQPFVLLYVGQTVCVLVRRRQHATMENKPPSLTAVACACFRGHIDDRDIDIDVLGVVDNVVAHRLGLGDDVDMKTLMNAAESPQMSGCAVARMASSPMAAMSLRALSRMLIARAVCTSWVLPPLPQSFLW